MGRNAYSALSEHEGRAVAGTGYLSAIAERDWTSRAKRYGKQPQMGSLDCPHIVGRERGPAAARVDLFSAMPQVS